MGFDSFSERCDLDGDGYTSDVDCDDNNANVNPDAVERCNGVDDDCDGSIPGDEVDDDEDGYVECTLDGDWGGAGTGLGDDCDDLHAAAYPDNPDTPEEDAAIEVCDSIDNDCDGLFDDADPDVVDGLVWYGDMDGDGYGDPANGAISCELPAGYVDNANDCDDTNGSIHPEADEVCDGRDNDCDGYVDEDDAIDALTWYADVDADGYGDPASAVEACWQPSWYVDNADDCNDLNNGVYPGNGC